jgi:hypothetical protein
MTTKTGKGTPLNKALLKNTFAFISMQANIVSAIFKQNGLLPASGALTK